MAVLRLAKPVLFCQIGDGPLAAIGISPGGAEDSPLCPCKEGAGLNTDWPGIAAIADEK